jgi:DNA-binding response OmpR family regulator
MVPPQWSRGSLTVAPKGCCAIVGLVVSYPQQPMGLAEKWLGVGRLPRHHHRDGPTGLDLARRESPALILLDLMPPAPAEGSNGEAGGSAMDGCEFLHRLRCEGSAGVIVWSRRDDEAIKLAALESGADGYLTWPSCSRLELLARMRAVLRRVERHKRTTPNTGKETPSSQEKIQW